MKLRESDDGAGDNIADNQRFDEFSVYFSLSFRLQLIKNHNHRSLV